MSQLDRFKFRVWFEGRFIYKSLCDSNVYTKDNKCICLANTLPNLPWEQCTGLKDKNGELIYEADIVSKEFTDRPFSSKAKSKIKNCLIYWNNGACAFSLKYKSDDYRYYSVHHNNAFCDCEIVGNIHTDKKLLDFS